MARRTKPSAHNIARRFMEVDKATRGCMLDLLDHYEQAAVCQQAYSDVQDKIDALEEKIRDLERGSSLTAKQRAQFKRLSKQVELLQAKADALDLEIDAAAADLDGILSHMQEARSRHVAELEWLFNGKA
jgi:chromosome segregation ATPase